MKITSNQAITAHQEGRLEEAESLYRSILKKHPTNLEVNNNLGVLLHDLGRLDEAEVSYKKAIELQPEYVDALYNLGGVLKDLNKLDEAEASYRKVIELKPEYVDALYNLGVVLNDLNKLDEAEASYRKAIELKPDYVEAHSNLAVILKDLNKLNEVEASYRKAIELKPDYAEIHHNLGGALKDLNKLDEAEASYRKAIKLKPDYVEAHSNLGVVLKDLNKFDEAEASYRKAIELKPDYEEALLNLDMLVRDKNLLDHIFKTKKSIKENKVSSADSGVGLTSNPFITHRNVETKLLKDLYKSELKELNKTKDARYGNGRCSDYKFLENDFPIIKAVREDLKKIMRSAVKSEIFIADSFLNIYGPKSGSTPHDHVRSFDKNQKLINQKYSLTYYLDIGDQNCSEPGNLKLYDPPEEIELSEGTIVIIPAARTHGAIYDGKTDRIMIGINFYSLI